MSNLSTNTDDDFIQVPTTVSPDGKISFKAVQEVYATVFRAEERLIKKFLKPADIELNNIIDICNKLEQYLEQFIIVASSKRATISYRSGQVDEFADWNRLKLIDRSKIDITKKVVLELDFLLSRSEQKKPRNYKMQIEIDSINGSYGKLPSSLAGDNGDESDADFFSALWHVRRSGVVRFTIEYTDYMIASTALAVVEKWYAAIPKLENWDSFAKAQKILNYRAVDVFTSTLTAIICLWITLSHGKTIEQIHGTTIAACSILILTAFFWKIINDFCEWGLSKFHSSPPSSTIIITDGDSQFSSYTQKKQKSGAWKFFTSIAGSIFTGILSKLAIALIVG